MPDTTFATWNRTQTFFYQGPSCSACNYNTGFIQVCPATGSNYVWQFCCRKSKDVFQFGITERATCGRGQGRRGGNARALEGMEMAKVVQGAIDPMSRVAGLCRLSGYRKRASILEAFTKTRYARAPLHTSSEGKRSHEGPSTTPSPSPSSHPLTPSLPLLPQLPPHLRNPPPPPPTPVAPPASPFRAPHPPCTILARQLRPLFPSTSVRSSHVCTSRHHPWEGPATSPGRVARAKLTSSCATRKRGGDNRSLPVPVDGIAGRSVERRLPKSNEYKDVPDPMMMIYPECSRNILSVCWWCP